MLLMICFIGRSIGHLFAGRTQKEIREFILSLPTERVAVDRITNIGDEFICIRLQAALPKNKGWIPIDATIRIRGGDVIITGTAMVPFPLRIRPRLLMSCVENWLGTQARNYAQEAIA